MEQEASTKNRMDYMLFDFHVVPCNANYIFGLSYLPVFSAYLSVFSLQSLLQLIFKIKLGGAITPDSCKKNCTISRVATKLQQFLNHLCHLVNLAFNEIHEVVYFQVKSVSLL